MINERQKGILINGIIYTLNERITQKNKKLCDENLHIDQEPLHGTDMFFKLAYMDDSELNKIAAKCGL